MLLLAPQVESNQHIWNRTSNLLAKEMWDSPKYYILKSWYEAVNELKAFSCTFSNGAEGGHSLSHLAICMSSLSGDGGSSHPHQDIEPIRNSLRLPLQ